LHKFRANLSIVDGYVEQEKIIKGVWGCEKGFQICEPRKKRKLWGPTWIIKEKWHCLEKGERGVLRKSWRKENI